MPYCHCFFRLFIWWNPQLPHLLGSCVTIRTNHLHIYRAFLNSRTQIFMVPEANQRRFANRNTVADHHWQQNDVLPQRELGFLPVADACNLMNTCRKPESQQQVSYYQKWIFVLVIMKWLLSVIYEMGHRLWQFT